MSNITASQASYAQIFHEGQTFRPHIESKAVDLFEHGKLFLFDPITHTDQCPITAYKVASLFATHQIQLEYLTSSFLINSSTIREKNKITTLCKEQESKNCNKFLSKSTTGQKAKEFVIDEINSYLKNRLEDLLSNHPQDKELQELKAILVTLSSCEHFTYPKFSGVMVLLRLLEHNPIPLILKIKTINPNGIQSISFFVDRAENKPRRLKQEDLRNQPVLVIEGFSVLDKKAETVLKDRTSCFHSIFRSSESVKHAETDHCSLCTPNLDPQSSIVETVSQTLESLPFRELILAAAAAFTVEHQVESYNAFFSSDTPLKELQKQFERSFRIAQEMKISISNMPSLLMIEHMYPDLDRYAFSEKRLIDSTPKEALEMREVSV